MLSERAQRQVDQLLDEAEAAIRGLDWATVRDRVQAVLALDRKNPDALAYQAAADHALAEGTGDRERGTGPSGVPSPLAGEGEGEGVSPVDGVPLGHHPGRRPAPSPRPGEGDQPRLPASFVRGRYRVIRFLGEGGKKRVYLTHDAQLDRDVAFALLKTEGLDAEGLTRLRREAQAMGRLGDHPHIVTVHDIGDDNGRPYIVCQFMAGGSIEDLLRNAADHRLPVDQALEIADQVSQALDHAHTHGVIHRDLKPGNVWLSGGDGDWVLGAGAAHAPSPQPSPARGEGASSPPPSAGHHPGRRPAPSPRPGEGASSPIIKLGDFGLALSLDRSRLTQAGMMVGTVAYMAPEQATGGPASPHSDLYALGCMLYEMVCGRPPFVGDESVAIISQHLNTPPVAPSWHRPDLTAGLEALILRLLEKDPSKRPASAAEVRQALAAVEQGHQVSNGEPGDAPRMAASPAGPLYRRTFVGREQELRQLQSAFDAALSGQGSLAMVVGEPGIGKTSLCEQLATYVAVRGGRALVGHCYEEGSLSLPYLPFVEAMRSYVLSREPDDLKSDLGSGAAEVARLISEIRDRIPVELRPPGDPEDDRWRLLQAVSGFLHNASTVQPLLLILEDLHDADGGTLDLLLHLSRNLPGSRLLIVGTYRDVEVDRGHPLSGALAELRRASIFLRVPLRGLTVDEVQRMMSIVRGQEVPWSRAEAIHRQTEGNPLFVQEVLRYLVEEGIVVREDGGYLLADTEAGIPEGLRDVVGKRLSRLSDKTNQALAIAAVIGREFRLDVLQKVAGLPEEELYAALEEANERAVVEQRQTLGTVGFRFTHAFFRQTLYEEIFIPRRIRLHQQVGKALEELYAPGSRVGAEQGVSLPRPAARPAGRLEEHAAELAEHFVQSTEPGDLEKALRYSELAAQRAMQVFAYGEAVRHLEQALRTQEVLDPDDKTRRCDLLLAQGEAMLPLEEPRRVADTVAEEAFALAEGLADSNRAAKAAVQAVDATLRTSGAGLASPGGSTRTGDWAARADHYAQVGTTERVYADIAQGSSALGAGQPAAAHVFLRKAVERAFELGDNAAFFAAAGWALARLQALRDRELRERLADEVRTHPRDGGRSRDVAQCLSSAGITMLGRGDRKAAEEVWEELTQLVERTRDATLTVQAMEGPALLALIDGRIEQALTLRETERSRGAAIGVAVAGHVLAGPLLLLGRADHLLGVTEGSGRAAQGYRALALAHLGRADEARAIRDWFGDIGSHEDETSANILTHLLDAAVLSRDQETAEALLPRLRPLADRISPQGVSIGRLLGHAARLLGQPAEEARDYYAQALEVCEKIRFRPEIALIRMAQTELLLEHYPDERTEALGYLDFAIKEFEAMKMQPSLEQALRLKESVSQ